MRDEMAVMNKVKSIDEAVCMAKLAFFGRANDMGVLQGLKSAKAKREYCEMKTARVGESLLDGIIYLAIYFCVKLSTKQQSLIIHLLVIIINK